MSSSDPGETRSAFMVPLLRPFHQARRHWGAGLSRGCKVALSFLSGGLGLGRPPAHTRTSLPPPGFRPEPMEVGGGRGGEACHHISLSD